MVVELYARKQRTYSENKTYSAITIDDLRLDLIKRIRKLASNQKVNHPWQDMDDFELLRSAGLYLKDYQSRKEGFTLAAVLLLGKDQRISLRNHIFREVISNILIHREYTNPYPAKLIIENDRVVTENSNKPHHYGHINPDNFSPFPKNPIIARVFKEIGWVDELGSGVRNIYKYSKFYSG
ncbi:hypothetical protein SDC9_83045 [bioreactor metagenome]|uniref:ATP-dependent DNA helicase RecG C-terminal domain-containing protein n=1 Tax=bioreactor metagenome TaxID=1076179 RepID=A0A644Z743_9ZZZZ